MKPFSSKLYILIAVLALLVLGGCAQTAAEEPPRSAEVPYKVVVPDAPEEQKLKTVLTEEPQAGTQDKTQTKTAQQAASDSSSAPSQADQDALWAQYKKLEGEQPEMLIDCTYCGGDGYYDEDCDSCHGSGSQNIPGTPYAAPCVTCHSTGNKPCENCFFGQMDNSNYRQQYDEWDATRRDILHQLGYTDEDIKQMDMAEARAYLDARQGSSGGSSYGGSSSGGSYTAPSGSDSCKTCFGSGNCQTCQGKHGYWNPLLLSDWVVCVNCDHGECRKCGGTGKK